jgi:phosphate-selective porin OprO/OprP
VDTGTFSADNVNLVGAEAAAVWGPASLQAEYMIAMVDSSVANDPDFSGYYVQGSYFLTGEHRNYKASSGKFDRVKPNKNFMGDDGGPGAWQLAARYSHVDLDDGAINGGELDCVTAGVNWYLNPNTRVMLNYVYADSDKLYDGEANIFQTRFQIDF